MDRVESHIVVDIYFSILLFNNYNSNRTTVPLDLGKSFSSRNLLIPQ